jgi:hypothetical protein
MSLYRLYRGDLAILMADGHEATATPLEFFEQGSGAFSKCRACYRPGLHMDTDSQRIQCHRCRTAALERLYGKLLEIDGFTTDIKRMILWNIFRHPVIVFKNEARALRVHHMTDLLRGPPWTYNPLSTTREAMQQDIRLGVTWKGKRYRVGRLSIYEDFWSLIIDFVL